MSGTYDNLGVKFLYPETWTVTDEQSSGWPRSVSLQTPEGAFWALQVFNEGSPQALANQALETMREEYPQLEADPIIEQVEALDVVGFDMRFYYLDFVVVAQARALAWGPGTLVLMCQAEDRDFDRLEPVFRAMLVSLLRQSALTALP